MRLTYEASVNLHTLIASGCLKSIDDCTPRSKNFLSMHLKYTYLFIKTIYALLINIIALSTTHKVRK